MRASFCSCLTWQIVILVAASLGACSSDDTAPAQQGTGGSAATSGAGGADAAVGGSAGSGGSSAGAAGKGGSGGSSSGGSAGSGGSSGAAGTGGLAGTAGAAGTGGVAGMGGSTGGSAGTGGATTWTVAAHPKEAFWANGWIAAHPSEPSTLAVAMFEEFPSPLVSVALTQDLGNTTTKAVVLSLPNQPGMYPDLKGFSYHPSDGQKLAGILQIPYGLPMEQLAQLMTSSTGGLSFQTDMLYMKVNPYPPDQLKFAAGAEPEMVVRSQHMVYLSKDLGQTWSASYDLSSPCLAHGPIAVSPSDHSVFVLACESTAAVLCKAETCSAVQVPAGVEFTAIEFDPQDGSRLVAGGFDGTSKPLILLSTDGGKTFAKVAELVVGVAKVVFDPRAGQHNVYVLDRAANKLFRSIDAGASWSDVTPPSDLEPPTGSYLYDFAVAADGAVVGLSAVGTLRLPPP